MPALSIIIPVYNMEKHLVSCLDSVYSQTCRDFEVIITDDGSTDTSPAICDGYRLRYPLITTVLHQKNCGLGEARNAAARHAQGDYLFFVDADDMIYPDAVGELSNVIKNTGADIVIFPIDTFDERGYKTEVIRDGIPDRDAVVPAECSASLITSPSAVNKVAKRTLYTENKISFPSGVWYEDIRTTPKLISAAGCIVYTKKPLYKYIRRSGSIMNSSCAEKNLQIIDAFEDLRAYFTENKLFDKYKYELELLAIDHVLISASVRVLRTGGDDSLLASLFCYVEGAFPDFRRNPYVRQLSLNRRLIYSLLCRKLYSLVRLIYKIR